MVRHCFREDLDPYTRTNKVDHTYYYSGGILWMQLALFYTIDPFGGWFDRMGQVPARIVHVEGSER